MIKTATALTCIGLSLVSCSPFAGTASDPQALLRAAEAKWSTSQSVHMNQVSQSYKDIARTSSGVLTPDCSVFKRIDLILRTATIQSSARRNVKGVETETITLKLGGMTGNGDNIDVAIAVAAPHQLVQFTERSMSSGETDDFSRYDDASIVSPPISATDADYEICGTRVQGSPAP